MNDGNILVVEDNPRWRSYFEDALASLYNVDTAVSLSTAIACAKSKYYDVAVVDLRLNDDARDRGGMQFIEFLGSIGEPTSVIIATSNATVDIATEAFMKYKAHALIEKQNMDVPKLEESVGSGIKDARMKLSLPNADAFFRGSETAHLFVDKFLRALHPRGGYEGLRSLLTGPLRAYWPLKHALVSPGLHVDMESRTASGRFWSRRLGKPISIRVCVATDSATPQSTIMLGTVEQALEVFSQAGLQATVSTTQDDLSEFEA